MGTSSQKASQSSSKAGRAHGAFWKGWLSATIACLNREPLPARSPISDVVQTMKWSHSILDDPTFCNEWQAIEKARSLAFELNVYSGICVGSVPVSCPFSTLAPSFSNPSRSRSLRFADKVDILIGMDDELFMHQATIPEACFAAGLTPWSSTFSTTNFFVSGSVEPLSSQAVSIPAHITLKPNRNEEPLMLDPSSSSDDPDAPRRGPGQRRIPLRNMPHWVTEIWNLLQEVGAIEMAEEGPVIYLQSFYISHLHHLREPAGRPLRFDRNYMEWAQDIQFMWEDLFDPHEPFELHLVRPEPPVLATQGTVGIVIISQHPVPRRTACLTTSIFNELPRIRIVHVAHSFMHWMDPRQLLVASNTLDACEALRRRQLEPCTIHIGRQHFRMDRFLRTFDGLGIVINVPAPFTAAEWEQLVLDYYQRQLDRYAHTPADDLGDEVTLMARRPQPRLRQAPSVSSSSTSSSSSTPSSTDRVAGDQDFRRTVVFPLSGQPQSLWLPWNNGRDMYQFIAEAFIINYADVWDTFYVSHRPTDFIDLGLQCLLLQQSSDPRPSPYTRLLLVDVDVFEDAETQPNAFSRFAKWLPRTLDRTSTFRMLGLSDVLERHGDRARLWHNNVFIEATHIPPLHLEDGDYLKIFVGASECEEECLIPEEEIPDWVFERIQGDTTSLFQTGLSVQPNQYPVNYELSISPSDRLEDQCRSEVPARTDHPQQPAAARLPILAFAPSALTQLVAIWDPGHGRAAGPQDPSTMIFDTWYLRDPGHHDCFHSRRVALPRTLHLWNQFLRTAWSDVVDPALPGQVFMVDHISTTSDAAGHILFVQNPNALLYAAMTTVFRIPDRQPYSQVARLLTRGVPARTLLSRVDIDFLCAQPIIDCAIFSGLVRLSLDQIWHDYFSRHLMFHLADPQTLEDDSMNLMQRSQVPRTSALGLTGGNSECADFHSQLNPFAPVFQPGQPVIHAYDDFTQGLYAVWSTSSFAWEDESPSASVMTWFVDHGWPQPHCFQPRQVQLYGDFDHWLVHLRRRWNDLIHDDQELEFHLVSPHPPHQADLFAAHIILIQRPRPEWVTSLVTIVDASGARAITHQFAATTHEQIMLDNLLLVAGIFHRCVGLLATLRCEAWYQDVQLTLQHTIPGRSGYGIVIQTHPLQHPSSAHSPALLQLHSSVQATASRLPLPESSPVENPVECRPDRLEVDFKEMWQTYEWYDMILRSCCRAMTMRFWLATHGLGNFGIAPLELPISGSTMTAPICLLDLEPQRQHSCIRMDLDGYLEAHYRRPSLQPSMHTGLNCELASWPSSSSLTS